MSQAAARDQALEFAERLHPLGPITVTRFFGGAGLVMQGTQFAFVIGGTLYIRVDDVSRPVFEGLGARPFVYAGRARTVKVASYYEVPDALADDRDELRRWATRAVHAAALKRPGAAPKASKRVAVVAGSTGPRKAPADSSKERFSDDAVAGAFASYPPKIRRKLLDLRQLIFSVASSTEGVGVLEESLKWGQPAYATSESKSGSTIRIDWRKPIPTQYAIYFHCQTNLIDTFKTLFPADFKFEGNRAIVFDLADPVPKDALAVCIGAALTYHRDKRRRDPKR